MTILVNKSLTNNDLRKYSPVMRKKNKQRIFTPDIYPWRRLWLNGGLIDPAKEQHDCIFSFPAALVVILALAWLVGHDRQNIRIRYILQLIIIEIALAFFFLHAESGLWLVKNISGFFASLLGFAAEGQFRLWRHERKRVMPYFLGRPVSDCVYFRADWYSSSTGGSCRFSFVSSAPCCRR